VNSARSQLPADDHAGWVLLLPAPRAGQRVLCLETGDVRFAEGAAFWFDDVTALNSAGDEAHFSGGSLSREALRDWRPGAPLPYAHQSFSVVVCRFAGSRAGRRAVATQLTEIARVLAPDGCLYVDVDNPGSYQLTGGLAGGGCRRGTLSRLLSRAGFSHQRHHAQIYENRRLAEVVAPRGYRASRNAWRLRERIKERLLGRLTQRWFAPAHAVLAARTPLGACGVDALPAMQAAGGAGFAQFLVNPGKCFVSAGPDAATVPLITVVPTRADTVSRRRTELAALQLLRAARLSIDHLLPRVAREVDHGRHPLFEYEAFAGTTIDLPVPGFDDFMERAFRVLCEFNRSSLERRALTAEEIAALIGRPLAVAMARYPSAAPAIERLRSALEAAVAGRVLPLTWQHGDYKLENLVFTQSDRAVRAIIDWELAAPRGLALVDLLYLLAYAEITLGAENDILPVVRACMLTDHWRPASRALLERYLREFPEVMPFKNVCIGLFLAHHVASRFAYDARDLDSQNAIADLMLNIAARLEARPGQSS